MKFTLAILLCLLSNFGLGQKLSDTGKFKMLNSYRKVLVAQQDRDARMQALCNADATCVEKQAKLGTTVQEYQKQADEEIKAGGFPAGTTFNFSKADKDEVAPILPEKKAEPKKPEEKK